MAERTLMVGDIVTYDGMFGRKIYYYVEKTGSALTLIRFGNQGSWPEDVRISGMIPEEVLEFVDHISTTMIYDEPVAGSLFPVAVREQILLIIAGGVRHDLN